MKAVFQEIRSLIESSHRITVISHDRPDGDAIGSSVGLGLLLEGLGKSVQIINGDSVPDSLVFLPESDRVQGPSEIVKSDLVITVDAAGRDRISSAVWSEIDDSIPLINIDHHVSNLEYGDINHVDSGSPATGQIICEMADALGWKLTKDVAENLYSAISTDTGSFRYPNTTAETYRIAAKLIDAGANVGRLNQLLYESYPQRRVEAIRDMLQDMQIHFEGRCASVMLPLSLTESLGLKRGDTEGVIDLIREIDTVVVAIFFEELPDGRIRVSSRSKSEAVSVGDICGTFGGGGHTLAAGARMKGPIEDAKAKFLDVVKSYLDL